MDWAILLNFPPSFLSKFYFARIFYLVSFSCYLSWFFINLSTSTILDAKHSMRHIYAEMLVSLSWSFMLYSIIVGMYMLTTFNIIWCCQRFFVGSSEKKLTPLEEMTSLDLKT